MEPNDKRPGRRVWGGLGWTLALVALLSSAVMGGDDGAEVAQDISLFVADGLSVEDPAQLAGAGEKLADTASDDQLEGMRDALRREVEDLGDSR